MENAHQISLTSQELCRQLVEEYPPPENLLPIRQVFAEINYQDGRTGRTEICFSLNFEKGAQIPRFLNVKISNRHRKEVFNGTSKLNFPKLRKYFKRSYLKRHIIITLSEMEFSQIDNDPYAEITLFWDDRESIFPFYI